MEGAAVNRAGILVCKLFISSKTADESVRKYKQSEQSNMSNKKDGVKVDKLQLHPGAGLVGVANHPDKNDDIEEESYEDKDDAGKDPGGKGSEAGGVGGGGGEDRGEHVDEDQQGGEEEATAGRVGGGREEETMTHGTQIGLRGP